MEISGEERLRRLAGDYFAPNGLYEYTKSLPFLGKLKCSVDMLTAGQWCEVVIDYEVGASGLADGAWIKGTFKFYSDWALFQTTDPAANNYVSAEHVPGPLRPGQTPATVQAVTVRFDQKGHERPFQKAILIDIVDGYANPGDRIVVRLGDRRFGARGTRCQTFVEDKFLIRWYIDPVGTSRFAAIKPDIAINIRSGDIAKLKIRTPRVVRPNVPCPIRIHAEDVWGNATTDIRNLQANLRIASESGKVVAEKTLPMNGNGWTIAATTLSLQEEADYVLDATVLSPSEARVISATEHLTVSSTLPVPRVVFADLHVHSDDTVGTNSTSYNFSYAKDVAGLDIVGYTANDFNITKAAWEKTLETICHVNTPGKFIVFPGTEWCGNSAAGGDHNVVFLEDPETTKPEFPTDHHGNMVRSFEWNEHGPKELAPGAWPLDEIYATYAQAAESHLLIPHVGGRRCNLAWHHPRLERLLEIGSAWGHFEWLLRDAIQRGWKMGICANSDEHRGRCGGGVPGTAVFGTKGGLTGVLTGELNRESVARSLRARQTFATTGERLVGLLSTKDGAWQGDDVSRRAHDSAALKYAFFGSSGFSAIEAWDASGCIYSRDLREEAASKQSDSKSKLLLITWGGARHYDRCREAVWSGSIALRGTKASSIQPFGGVTDIPEEAIQQKSPTEIVFETRTSGDFDGVAIALEDDGGTFSVDISGKLGGYVKVGDALSQNPHQAQPEFSLRATAEEASEPGGKSALIRGGAELFVRAEFVADIPLPRHVEGEFDIIGKSRGEDQAVYLVGREWAGGKVITSPIFITWA